MHAWLPAFTAALGCAGALSAAAAADATAPAPTAAADLGYAFAAGQARYGRYDLHQDAVLSTAGDRLTYTTTMGWRFVMLPLTITPDRVELAVTFFHADATLSGPGTENHVDTDSDDDTMKQDPVFGHLYALKSARLILVVDPHTGIVIDVQGAAALADAVAKDAPSALGPTEPSPIAAAAKAAYDPQALARMWTAMLVRPGITAAPLGPPLGGNAARTWVGYDYTLGLAPGSEHLDATLGQTPVAVAANLQTLTGTGHQGLSADLQGTATGTLHAVFNLTAMTQGAAVDENVTWTLTRGVGK